MYISQKNLDFFSYMPGGRKLTVVRIWFDWQDRRPHHRLRQNHPPVRRPWVALIIILVEHEAYRAHIIYQWLHISTQLSIFAVTSLCITSNGTQTLLTMPTDIWLDSIIWLRFWMRHKIQLDAFNLWMCRSVFVGYYGDLAEANPNN